MKITKEHFDKAFHEKHAIQRSIARKLFSAFQWFGIHVTGDHFYEITPNTKLVKKTYSDAKRPCKGVSFSYNEASDYVYKIINKWGPEFNTDATAFGYKQKNHFFSGLDALVLYAIIRDKGFPTVVEVGGGISTGLIQCAMSANNRATGLKGKFISIDPYERARVANKKLQGVDVKIIQTTLQDADPFIFKKLDHNCLLFIDSSHVHKFGSDVKYFFEAILPEIGVGTIIHIHDIFSPYEYPYSWIVKQKRFWNEQYALENFLKFNSAFETLIPLHYLERDSVKIRKCAEVKCDHPDFNAQGASYYIRRVSKN